MSVRSYCSRLVRKLYFVYFLNVIDYVCTLALVSTGRFFEANPLANTFIDDVYMGIIVKCVVPFGLLYFVCRCMHILSIGQLRFADMLISFALTVYLFIMADHLINFVILFFF